MRIGTFEWDGIFQPCFTLAEVCNGSAHILRSLRIRNVRGTADDWLRIRLEINGKCIRQKGVRNLKIGDEEYARQLEDGILNAFVLPEHISPGIYSLRLLISHIDGEVEQTSSLEVLPAHVIPTDFARAPLLAAYIQENNTLRTFAAESLQGIVNPDALQTIQEIYNALLDRLLVYQPVTGRRNTDCQPVSQAKYVLERGGSCADLSLLLSSLLWSRGVPPVLLLFQDHMASGCFLTTPPAVDLLYDNEQISTLIQKQQLALVDIVGVCRHIQHPYALAAQQIVEYLQRGDACVLINVQHLLRNGIKPVPESITSMLRCPVCGYDRFAKQEGNDICCPACGHEFHTAAYVPSFEPASTEAVSYSSCIQYGLVKGSAAVLRLNPPAEEVIYISPLWQGKSVRCIGERAFMNTAVSQLTLPASVVHLGDYAFSGCTALKQVFLPCDLITIGSGVFCGSGLKGIRIPGSIRRISRMAFAQCADLEKVELREGIQVIDEWAFSKCDKLKSIQIPSTVTYIAKNAFPPDCKLLLLSSQTRII